MLFNIHSHKVRGKSDLPHRVGWVNLFLPALIPCENHSWEKKLILTNLLLSPSLYSPDGRETPRKSFFPMSLPSGEEKSPISQSNSSGGHLKW